MARATQPLPPRPVGLTWDSLPLTPSHPKAPGDPSSCAHTYVSHQYSGSGRAVRTGDGWFDRTLKADGLVAAETGMGCVGSVVHPKAWGVITQDRDTHHWAQSPDTGR